MTGLIAFKLERCRRNSTQRHGAAEPQPNLFGLRREAKRHAALEVLSAVEKRCRRCALPPQSKFLSISQRDHRRSQDAGYSGWNTMALRGGRQNSAECCWLWQGTFSAVTPPRLPWLLPA